MLQDHLFVLWTEYYFYISFFRLLSGTFCYAEKTVNKNVKKDFLSVAVKTDIKTTAAKQIITGNVVIKGEADELLQPYI